MAETPDNATPESEPVVRFAIDTPDGPQGVNVDDLTEELRDALVQSLHADGLPDELRMALAKALGVDLADSPASATTGTERAASGTDAARNGTHEPGCGCAERHRDTVWTTLDTAFPNDPHLWQAMESLFKLSAVNPQKFSDAARRSALNDAALHIQNHIELTAPPLSPLEQMVAQFRDELGL